MYKADILGSQAYAKGLVQAGVIDEEERKVSSPFRHRYTKQPERVKQWKKEEKLIYSFSLSSRVSTTDWTRYSQSGKLASS